MAQRRTLGLFLQLLSYRTSQTPSKSEHPAGNTPFYSNDIIGVNRELPGANFEACLELRRLNVERRYDRLDTLGMQIDLMSGTDDISTCPASTLSVILKSAIGIQNTPGMVIHTCLTPKKPTHRY